MKIIGLTGSIAMGKSTAAALLRRMGVPIYDADATIHRLTGPGGAALAPLGRLFPDCVGPQGLDRARLGPLVFANPGLLKQLESILHPLARAEQRRFIGRMRRHRRRAVVLDIPLLFETAGLRRFAAILVVSAPRFLQAQRAMRRPGMSLEKFRQILARQTPDAEKRRRADFVIPSGLGRGVTYRRLQFALRCIISKHEPRDRS